MRYTFQDFVTEYPTDEACLDRIMELRHGHESICPNCEKATKFHRITKRRAYACQSCGHHIYPCAGTPFEKSRTSLQKWFFAMYLFTASRNGVAAKELQRQLGVTYKTAWRMAHELRKLMAQSDDHEPLSGHIEMDETFVGGKQKRGKFAGPTNKTTVFGMVQRDGSVRAGPVPNAAQGTLHPHICMNVVRGSTVSTDKWRAYDSLKELGYRHGSVNHSAKQWVKGEHHTNTIENFWGQIKRGIKGTHIHVSRKHMWKYISEFSFRYNLRKEPELMFQSLLYGLTLPRLADD
ncbi:IS1595 family transposase [Thalassospiraceae bacterium LMO-JJ14]|nr:IS1595 family transposase [Thalassospiraceae bacterium LMO-JJ14]